MHLFHSTWKRGIIRYRHTIQKAYELSHPKLMLPHTGERQHLEVKSLKLSFYSDWKSIIPHKLISLHFHKLNTSFICLSSYRLHYEIFSINTELTQVDSFS